MFSKSSAKFLKNSIVFDYLKGIIVAMMISLGLILLLAVSFKWVDINSSYIPFITILIKSASVVVGSIIAIKGSSKGLIKGTLFGVIYIAVAFIVFSGLSGEFSLNLSFGLDLISAATLGGLVGIVKVNKR